jgi:hypothetical protein
LRGVAQDLVFGYGGGVVNKRGITRAHATA